ncbi:hypothetical protein QAD02_011815 [Eretmocerus hayati]|uniref:Uncharacterized protein n=1 Tax=Eretmocerus hayati TaxID=131215 RepID=A0ACC2NXL6_9HYME|nr:hypothetical protein QAD02_011815 [Eretmocerus hayati]
MAALDRVENDGLECSELQESKFPDYTQALSEPKVYQHHIIMNDQYRGNEKKVTPLLLREYIESELDDRKYGILRETMQSERCKRKGCEVRRQSEHVAQVKITSEGDAPAEQQLRECLLDRPSSHMETGASDNCAEVPS